MRVGDTQPIHVDLRIIAATNRDLEKAVERREFRQDLYYRLKGIAIHLPPLRERAEDIPLLAYHFLKKYRGTARWSASIPRPSRLSTAYKWPGNIRELEHVIEYALSMTEGDTIQVTDLPEEFLPGGRQGHGPGQLDELPFRQGQGGIRKILHQPYPGGIRWNVSEASRKAQMFRQNLQQKIRKYGICAGGRRRREGRGVKIRVGIRWA